MNTYRRSNKSGFAILFAVLTASVLLSIGLSIFNITVKELVLSSSGRESQFAFYAADTGLECAFYWDFQAESRIFATSSQSVGRNPTPSNPDCVSMFGQTPQYINITPGSATPTSATTVFDLSIPNSDSGGSSAPYCANVTVIKNYDGTRMTTTIESRGYNTCDVTDPNRVERGLRAYY